MEKQIQKKKYNRKKSRKRRKKPTGWTAAACLLTAVLVVAGLLLYKHYTQMVQIADDGIEWEDVNRWTVLNKEGYSESVTACEMDGELFVSAGYVNTEYAEEALFLDTGNGKIYYTTASRKTVYTPDSSKVYVQDEEYIYDRIFNTYNEEWLVKLEWASEQFGIGYSVNNERKIITLYPDERETAGVFSETKVYLKKTAGSGSVLAALTGNTEGYSYYRILQNDEVVICVGEEGEYTKVLTADGYIGYVESHVLRNHEIQYTVKPEKETVELPDHRKVDGKVVLAWHQDYTGTFTESTQSMLAETSGVVNVLSPTWFKFTDSGKLISCANNSYAEWAHGQGYQIWALIDNDFADEKTYSVLKDDAKRANLIEEVLAACKELKIDGINVDFEGLSSQTAPYFIEFLRELCAVLRPEGYCVTVDVSVPEEWSSYYRRDLLAKCCDYVIVMGYDEHYRGGGSTGSVSSVPWAEKAVETMLEMVPVDKVILGIPFYTQLWSTASDGEIYNEALSMEEAAEWIYENGTDIIYDEASGQEYASAVIDGTLYEIWIENAISLRKRLVLTEEHQLAGVACWKLGMENEEAWQVMAEYGADR